MFTDYDIIKRLAVDAKNELDAVGGLRQIVFVSCGGSLSAAYPAQYFLRANAINLRVEAFNSSEFLNAPPKFLCKNTLVIGISTKATAETVEALKLANNMGCLTIALSGYADSLTAKEGKYCLTYRFSDDWYDDPSLVHCNSMGTALKLAVELLHLFENFPEYNEFLSAFAAMPKIYAKAYEKAKLMAVIFAQKYKKDTVFNVLGSGAAWESTYTDAFCFLQEMQSVHCVPCHSGEYFHGPFETCEDDLAIILLKSVGRNRILDERAEKFLRNFCKHHFVIDAKNLGLEELGEVAEYFNPLILRPISKQLIAALADARKHPLSTRRYMWKYDY